MELLAVYTSLKMEIQIKYTLSSRVEAGVVDQMMSMKSFILATLEAKLAGEAQQTTHKLSPSVKESSQQTTTTPSRAGRVRTYATVTVQDTKDHGLILFFTRVSSCTFEDTTSPLLNSTDYKNKSNCFHKRLML
jgi:hypothetical protein